MRLIIPLVIILLGILTGAFVCWLFRAMERCLRLSIAAGVLGAFAGIITRDALDITAGGPALGAFVGAVIGAVTLSALVNVWFRFAASSTR